MTLRGLAVPALAASLFVTATAGNAHAYCRTNSCDTSRGEDCKLDSTGCIGGGLPLAWVNSCVTFAVQRDGSTRNNIHPQALEGVVTHAFETWMKADCGGDTHPSISVSSLGEVECKNVEYNRDQGNANIVLFRDDDWDQDDAANALALTTVWYDYKTGEIYDADIEINGTARITNGAPQDGADLPSIITHETGHFLGLGHTVNNPDATMNALYEPGVDNLRVLHPDDIRGICAVYPPEREAKSDNCDPRHGFATTCRKDDSGCAAVPGRSGEQAGWMALGMAMVGVMARRRKRRRG